jgi:hypothetical protein
MTVADMHIYFCIQWWSGTRNVMSFMLADCVKISEARWKPTRAFQPLIASKLTASRSADNWKDIKLRSSLRVSDLQQSWPDFLLKLMVVHGRGRGRHDKRCIEMAWPTWLRRWDSVFINIKGAFVIFQTDESGDLQADLEDMREQHACKIRTVQFLGESGGIVNVFSMLDICRSRRLCFLDVRSFSKHWKARGCNET